MPSSAERDIRPCVLIPHYNHPRTLGRVCAAVTAAGVDCLVVDDGSGAQARRVARALTAPPQIRILLLSSNQGKGMAFEAGVRHAARLGYSHVLQIDADGQHDAGAIPELLAAACAAPAAVITGYSAFDASVPRVRYYGRYLTHALVWLNTLSLEIRDSMCGMRVYPVGSTLRLLDSHRVGRRMDFDTDIIVRLHWAGVRVRNLPVAVRYPADGVSHFRMGRDNARLALMHTRHFMGMLARLPDLVPRNMRRARTPTTRSPVL